MKTRALPVVLVAFAILVVIAYLAWGLMDRRTITIPGPSLCVAAPCPTGDR